MEKGNDVSVFWDDVSFELNCPVTGIDGQMGSFKAGRRTRRPAVLGQGNDHDDKL